ncbi:hypothetical protein IEQ34_003147 [Dendrobium chrysotoxum]|uniref:Uncharacterized protein n=1 Tax=Dendrobium chrysotoxum TaxID=161865 RepID=A0AAV7HIW6_DENCH|nr:hypothetical protein IEQ34_003147 [Dendrobium chrysotoxum]
MVRKKFSGGYWSGGSPVMVDRAQGRVTIEGLFASHLSKDSSPNLDDDDIESELIKAFSSDDEDVEIIYVRIPQEGRNITLEGLEYDDYLQLLNNHVFANVEDHDVHYNKLRSIAKEIVKKRKEEGFQDLH